MSAFIEGLVLQAGLIVALGAQNLFVIETGIRRHKQWLVSAICAGCDSILLFIGVFGFGRTIAAHGNIKIALGAVGVAFLAVYAVRKLRAGFEAPIEATGELPTLRRIVLTTLAFTLLNPHVYLDTVVLTGTYSTKFDTDSARFAFASGASAFSVLWFFGLSTAAARLSAYLSRPRIMARVHFVSGVVLAVLSYRLGVEVIGWL